MEASSGLAQEELMVQESVVAVAGHRLESDKWDHGVLLSVPSPH